MVFIMQTGAHVLQITDSTMACIYNAANCRFDARFARVRHPVAAFIVQRNVTVLPSTDKSINDSIIYARLQLFVYINFVSLSCSKINFLFFPAVLNWFPFS